jgi:hypothetical protein
MAGNRHDHGGPPPSDVLPPDQDQSGQPPEGGYERRDVNEWAVGKFAIALVLLCIFAMAVLVGFFHFLQTINGPVAEGVRPVPPQPRLQTTPVLDLRAMRDAEDKVLNGYGWVDQSKGVARVPIAKAIDLLAQRGLPARPQNGVQSASNATVPTESGLGEIVQQPGGPLGGVAK